MKKLLCGLCLCAAAMTSQALELVNSASTLSVVSVKNNRLAELFSFTNISGEFNASTGEAVIGIALTSVETGIPIRDKRIKSYLFNVDQDGSAAFTAKIDPEELAAVAVATPQAMPLHGELTINGKRQTVSFDTLVTKFENGEIRVVTTAPAFIDLVNLGLEGGIDKLRELAGLNAINLAVPVSFSVLFR